MDHKNQVSDVLYIYGKKKILYTLVGRIVLFFLIFFLLWFSVVLADSVFYFSTVTRWGLFFLNILVILILINQLLKQPFKQWYSLQKSSDLSTIAKEIGNDLPDIKDRLVNLYQLSNKEPSPVLNAAVNQIADRLGDKAYADRLNLKDFLPGYNLLIPVCLSAILLLSFQANEIYRSTLRLINPSNSYAKTPAYSFTIEPGDIDILYNTPLEVNTSYSGPQAEEIYLTLFNNDPEAEPRKIIMGGSNASYSTRLKNITQSFTYVISAKPQSMKIEDILQSDIYHVNVLIPPKLQDLSIKVIPPKYSGLKVEQNEQNDGNITALVGSRATIKIVTNKVLKKSYLVFPSGDSIKILSKGKVAEGDLFVKNSDSYKIILEDTEGLVNQDPISYTLSVLPDNPPYVDITEPGTDIEAQLEDIVRLKIDAADDYGLTNLFLKYRYIKQSESADSTWHNLSINDFKKGQLKTEVYEYLDFSKFYVGYNDQMEYYAVAVDNDAVGGANISNSPVYNIRFPSLDEVFDEFTEKEEEKIDDLEQMTKDSDNLKEKLEEINRELKRTEKMEWELKKQIENSIEQQKNAQEKIEKIQQEIQEMVDKLDHNSLMNPEVMEKYNELQNLFQEIAPPELLDAMRKLQQALEKENPNQVQKALENFKLNQETFQANLERTLELFKQVQLEQQMDQLVQQAQKLAEKQEEISKNLQDEKNETKDQKENLQNEQGQQQDLLSSLQRNLDKMTQDQQLQKFPKAKDQLEQTSSEINEKNLKNEIQQLQQQLSQQQDQQTLKNSRNLQKSFEQVQQQLSSAQQQLQQQNKQNVQKKMLSAAKKMLQLSQEQERVQKETKDASQLNDDLRQMARQQANLQSNLSKIVSDIIQLSKETFYMDNEMNKNLANAASSMQKSMDDLSERRNSQAANEQQQAMEALNKSIDGMQKSMEQLAGAKSGTGFEQFMEQLKQMAGAQGGLNGETLNFMEGQGNDGQLSSKQQAQRQRLAAQQKAIRDALNEMNEGMGNRSDVLGRLGEMSEQMDEIVKDMLANNINRKTIDRQRQILSRMLDAQKSVREREYSKKRKAEQAKKYTAIDPGTIKDQEDLAQKKLQEALNKALSEGYHNEYQQLINAYFKQLSSGANIKQ